MSGSRFSGSISRVLLASTLSLIASCASDADDGDRPGPEWAELTQGDGLDHGAMHPTPAGTAAYYVSATDRVYRLDGQAVPLPAEITSLPSSDRAAAIPDEDRTRSSLIFGADDRVPYTSDATLTGYNKRAIGLLNTAVGQCSGSLIGPRHVLTSAHCLLDANGNFTATSAIRFAPGHRGVGFGTTDPNGAPRKAVGYFTRTNNDTWDYALIILEDQASTASLGWMGLRWSTDDSFYEGRTVSLVGYPGSTQVCTNSPGSTFPFCGGFQYGMSCPIDWADEDLEFECDATGGNSGGPLYGWFSGMPDVLGVLRGSTSTPFNDWNKAVRLNHTKMGDLCSWILSSPSTFAARSCLP